MKSCISLLIMIFTALSISAQVSSTEQAEKASFVQQDNSIIKEQKQEILNQQKAPKKNIQASQTNAVIEEQKIDRTAIQAKIDYLLDLQCCEAKIQELQKQLLIPNH